MKDRAPIRFEQLESRENPVTFGTPWPDGLHLTMSFAPDGTPVAGTGSNLGQFLSQLGPQARMDVLRAFQTWVVNANVNVGLVSDTGAAFGTGGSVQGDPRFGDIRVGGQALSSDVLAVTAPYNLYDNYSGDVVVNTAQPFGTTYDLFTALMQEAGHSFGVGNSTDPASVMYEYYSGTRAGLSAGDVSSIQGLYGARRPDRFEGSAGNDTLATATPYSSGLLGIGGPTAADVTTTHDVDVYKVTTGLLTSGLTVHLQASGLSLLTAKVEILDSSGKVVASAATFDPTNNDLTVSLPNPRILSTYYVRVSSARPDVFGVGAYQLDVQQSSVLTSLVGTVNQLLTETGLNDTLAAATSLLSATPTVSTQTEYSSRGGYGSSSDVDYYQILVPGTPGGQPTNMAVTVWGLGGAALNPWVEVYDALGHRLDGQVLTADGNTTTFQVGGLLPGQVYYIKTFSDTKATGSYQLAADLRDTPAALPVIASGTLPVGGTSAPTPFTMSQTDQAHFVVSATGTTGAAKLVVTDSAGNVVATATAAAGRSRSVDVFLPAGTYQVTVSSAGGAPLGYQAAAAVVTDPVGVTPTDPTTNPEPTSPPPTDTSLPPSPPPPPPPTDPTPTSSP